MPKLIYGTPENPPRRRGRPPASPENRRWKITISLHPHTYGTLLEAAAEADKPLRQFIREHLESEFS